ncbi:MAG: RNA pseudouridine synthase [Planctomycetota bacterium]|nr:MAG: RNA pseudouridine synthase [Planctomycetota bacterium]
MPTDPHAESLLLPTVLHDEPHWFVVNKPAGMHTVAQPNNDAPSVEAWLRATRPDRADIEECGLVHRLDLDTSGCVLVAKSAKARVWLRDAFSGRGGDIRKMYLARVEGFFAERVIAGAFTLSFSSRHKGSAKVSVGPRGEPETIGRCRWNVKSSSGAGEPASTLLEVELLGPGRRHQIRAGMAHEGHPLVGDTLYGARALGTDIAPIRAICLHAWRVEVEGIQVECPPPAWA